MSEYELIYLLEEIRTNMSGMIMMVFTFVSSYLIVAFLVAHRLTRTMTVLLNILFVVMMLLTAGTQIRIGNNLVYVTDKMKEMAATGGGLAGHPVTASNGLSNAVGPVFSGITVLILLGSLYFFFHARRTNISRAKNAVDQMIDAATGNTKDDS